MTALTIRLLRIDTWSLDSFPITSCPPYLAVSHAWGERVFTEPEDITLTFGYKAIQKVVQDKRPELQYCWIDNFCIKQDNDKDKLIQIPLMGRIYGSAEDVVIMLGCELGLTQTDVDHAMRFLDGAIAMFQEEAWAEEGDYWQKGPGRRLLVRAMRYLTRFAGSAWPTRVWTLQEYVLGRSIIWIGKDLEPLIIDDMVFSALPGVCQMLDITECQDGEFQILYSHISGMADVRIGMGDRTRIMELLGNRTASVPVDEVYGVMAAARVEIDCIPGETKEQAWSRWLEAAIAGKHFRWLMLPVDVDRSPGEGHANCIFPSFQSRHKLSASSYLESVQPLGPFSVSSGVVSVAVRYVGSCTVLRRLGTVHEPQPNRIHRDLTLILFSRGKFELALEIAVVFSAGRLRKNTQIVSLAQTMVRNYSRVLEAVAAGSEDSFRMDFRSHMDEYIWSDLMRLQSGLMMTMNNNVAYLCRIQTVIRGFALNAVLIAGETLPSLNLLALDLGAVCPDGRRILMIVASDDTVGRSSVNTTGSASSSMHKVGTTFPLPEEHGLIFDALEMINISIGGSTCLICRNEQIDRRSPISPLVSANRQQKRHVRQLRLLQRTEKRLDRKLRISARSNQMKQDGKRRTVSSAHLATRRIYREALERLRHKARTYRPKPN